MFKKTAFSFIFFCLLQLVLYSCCKSELFHIKVESIAFQANDSSDNDASSVTNEDLSLILTVDYSNTLIASVIDASMISNAVYATTQCYDDYIMPNPVTAINVVASETIFGINAGDSINEKLEFYTFIDSNPNQELEGIPEYLNSIHSGTEIATIVFNDQIQPGTSVSFTITLSFENGSEQTSTTQLIQLE